MQNAARYREFAEILIAAAQDCGQETRQVVLSAAAAWTALADAEERAASSEAKVVSFDQQRRLRAG